MIASVWGNTTYDQTVQAYDTAAARDSQWPTPKDGAHAYTLDTGTVWVRRAGAWKMVPLGFIAAATGPASQTDAGAGLTSLVALSFPVTLGRRYRVTAYALGSQQTATGPAVSYRITDDQGATQYLVSQATVAVGVGLTGSTAALYTPTSTKTAAVTLYASATGGVIRTVANACAIFAEDIGT